MKNISVKNSATKSVQFERWWEVIVNRKILCFCGDEDSAYKIAHALNAQPSRES